MTLAITDPAREIVDLIRGLTIPNNKRGDTGLAGLWGVPAWSSEFYQIIFSISHRIDEVAALVDQTSLDDDQKGEIKESLENVRTAFGPNGLQNQWSYSIQHYLTAGNIAPISMLSGLIRPIRSYPRLDEEQIAELVNMVTDVRTWLADHQIAEQDFIRQALIEGLDQMLFRLVRIKWLGWGYTLDSLKDVITAYMVLERGYPEPQANTSAAAALKMLSTFIKGFYERTQVIKDVTETGDWLLRIYGGVMAVAHGGTQVAGLLSHLPQ